MYTASSLILLSILGGYCLHGFATTNGLYDAIKNLNGKSTLHDGTPYSNTFTGTALDRPLSTILTFFWPVVDGSQPDLSLASLLFGGQFVAAWTVTMLEGMRKGNHWRLASYTTIFGMLVQTLAAGFIVPAYLALHLFTSSTVKSPTPEDLFIPESSLRALPYSLTLGFIALSVLMALPTHISGVNQVHAVLIWQAFPLWIQLIQTVLSSTIFASSSSGVRTSSARNKTQLRLLRRIYTFALTISAQVHVATKSLSVATLFFPSLFTLSARESLSPLHIFIPPNPFNRTLKIASVGQGAFWFIQFDYIIAGVAYHIWGLAVKYKSLPREQFSWSSVLWDAVGWRQNSLGLMSNALCCVWERDERVLSGVLGDGVKKLQ